MIRWTRTWRRRIGTIVLIAFAAFAVLRAIVGVYLSTQWTPTTTIAALTPRFSPRVPALEMW